MPTSPAGAPRIGGHLATDRRNQQVGPKRPALRARTSSPHFEPAYARHYIGWTRDLKTRMAEHRAGTGSPLIRAALAAGVRVDIVATMPGSRYLERRLKRWKKTG
jgi:hypothetical protein